MTGRFAVESRTTIPRVASSLRGWEYCGGRLQPTEEQPAPEEQQHAREQVGAGPLPGVRECYAPGNCLSRAVQAYQRLHTASEISGMTDLGAHDLTRGLNGELGFRLVEWREGFARVTVDLDERHKNRQGGLHGGVTAALVDAATGYCGVYEPDPEKRRSNVTVSLNVNFVSRPKGATLTCTAETIRAGRRIYFASAVVHDETGNLIASAEAVYAYVDREAQGGTTDR